MEVIQRNTVKESDKWDLNKIYTSLDQWKADFQKVEGLDAKAITHQGTLGNSAEHLAKVIAVYLESQRILEKVYTYAHLKSDEDTSNTENLGLLDRAYNLYGRHSEAWSFFSPELLSLKQEIIDSYLKAEILKPYRRSIKDIVRYKPHTLNQREEKLIAAGAEVFQSTEKVFSQLNNADLNFGSIKLNGQKVPLTHGSYSLILKNPDRKIRKKTFEQFYQVFEGHKNTIAATLSGSIKKDVYLAKIKNFRSAREASLFSDNVSTDVYDNLINTVSKNLKPLHQYYKLRKNILKISGQRIFDTYVPLVPEINVEYTFEKASSTIIDSLNPLGDEYCNVLTEGLGAGRWVDRYENKGKRSGAYSSGCYDSPPYILMNFKSSDLRDVFTLTHEAGHSMHSYFSIQNQAFQDYNYTIFVAEVASTFNEMLLNVQLKKVYKDDPKMLAYLINNQIDDIKSTLYRQAMFAEFEYLTHQVCEENQPLTVDVFRKIYRELLVKYFGQAVKISELDDLECLRIPHFYSAFYVYKYSTGISAAISLAKQVLEGGKTELDKYLNFLKTGGSKYPLDALTDAGVDMKKSTPIENALSYFAGLVNELEIALGE